MPALTRRRSDNPHLETWHVFFDDVRVGTIGERAGVPVHADQWTWLVGSYPGMEPGTRRHGTPDSAFAEWRHDRDRRAEMKARRARGEKLDSETRSTLMRCACGTVFNSWNPTEGQLHRPHIYAMQAADEFAADDLVAPLRRPDLARGRPQAGDAAQCRRLHRESTGVDAAPAGMAGATKALLLVAEPGGDPMLARIGMMRALNAGKLEPVIARSKRVKSFRVIGSACARAASARPYRVRSARRRRARRS